VAPGELRTRGIVVGNVYKGAPAQDCGYLVAALCDWLNGTDFQRDGKDHAKDFLHAFLRAVVAHVYIAWIHPFGDGNGRTARLVELGILTAAGIPSVAAHLLSNHYNATRSNYYRQLEYASKSGGDLVRFLGYAAEGFVGQLQQQLNDVHELIVNASWVNYVHSMFPDRTLTARRQRDLVLALEHDSYTRRADLITLTPERTSKGIRARRELILAFLPRVTPGSEENPEALFPATA
jgi:hypothetical protein